MILARIRRVTRRIAALSLLIAPLAMTGCKGLFPTAETPRPAPGAPVEAGAVVRVAVLRNAKDVRLGCGAGMRVAPGDRGGTVIEGVNAALVTPSEGGFMVNGKFVLGESLFITPRDDAELDVSGKPYPGRLRITKGKGGLLCVNLVPVERYVKGVVGREMYASWPPEALKAQAVASRSFVLAHHARRKRHPYDVTTQSQQYGSGVHPAVEAAVNATRGEVLTYAGKPATGYFCSSCGGHTVSAENAFGGKDEPHITGLSSPYCEGCPRYRWRLKVTTKALSDRLFGAGSGRRVLALQCLGRRPDGRVRAVRVYTSDGDVDMPVREFRKKLGSHDVGSALFRVKPAPGGFLLEGRGFGHGVGLCQYGAKTMAERGADHRAILRHFYPNLTLKRLTGVE